MRILLLLAAVSIVAAVPTNNWQLKEKLRSMYLQQPSENQMLAALENIQDVIQGNTDGEDHFDSWEQLETEEHHDQATISEKGHSGVLDTDICGEDDRSVTSTSTIPFQWICKLKISDGTSFGTGFLIKISPDVGHPVLMTAAHVLRKSRLQYVDKVEVYCPGRAKETVYPDDMWASDEFLRDYNWHHDYGFLKLSFSSDSNTGFGWSGYFDKDDIEGIHLHTCGYPSFKKGTSDANADNLLYCDTDELDESDERDESDEPDRLESAEYRIEANLDIAGGQSGGPLFAKIGNEYIAFGLVSSGGCPRRHFECLSAEKIYKILDKVGYEMTYKVWGTKDVYLHMNANTFTRTVYKNTGGRVYLAKDDKDDLTKVNIYPVWQTSSNIFQKGSYMLFDLGQ